MAGQSEKGASRARAPIALQYCVSARGELGYNKAHILPDDNKAHGRANRESVEWTTGA